MDLTFSRLIAADATPLPAADAALLRALLSRPVPTSATAAVQAALAAPADIGGQFLLATASGAFSAAMARRLADWRDA